MKTKKAPPTKIQNSREVRELKKMNQELDRFVYSTSHDLKAPLRSIMGIVNIARKETTDPKLLSYMEMIHRSASKLDNFINDLTNFSRNSRLTVKYQKINFNEVLDETIDHLSHLDNTGSIQVLREIENTPFYSDLSRIKIIFSNLISNSIKYKNPDASVQPIIQIKITVKGNKATLVFSDNGEGISKDHQKKIFQMFYRASERSQGSGLGLFIVMEVIKKLKGKIQLHSEEGKGARFTITLPNAMN